MESVSRDLRLCAATIGRFLLVILPSQRSFLDEEQLTLWLGITEFVALNYQTPGTAQKALEASVLIFPIARSLGEMILSFFRRIILVNKGLRRRGFESLAAAFSRVGQADLIAYVVKFRDLFEFEESRPLARGVCDYKFELSGDMDGLYDALEVIGAKDQIVPFFDRIGRDRQKRFISAVAEDFEMLMTLWNRFCEGRLDEFGIFHDLIGRIQKFLFVKERMMAVLEFVKESKVAARRFGENERCCKWHLFGVIALLIPLLNVEHLPVRKFIGVLVEMFQSEMKAMVS
jgi:hypothetical protein